MVEEAPGELWRGGFGAGGLGEDFDGGAGWAGGGLLRPALALLERTVAGRIQRVDVRLSAGLGGQIAEPTRAPLDVSFAIGVGHLGSVALYVVGCISGVSVSFGSRPVSLGLVAQIR